MSCRNKICFIIFCVYFHRGVFGVDGVVGVDCFFKDGVLDKRLDGLLLGVGFTSFIVSNMRIFSSVGDIKFTSGDVMDVY